MLQITEIEIKKRLAFDNPWWETGSVDERYRNWPKRAYFGGILRLVKQTEVNRAVVLMGPRRVGKTVMLTQMIQALIEEGIPHKSICYVSVDTPTYTGINLEQLLRWFMEIHERGPKDRLFVFFDEIQYHPDWERHLKSLVDSFPDIRFVVSGSAAAALKMRSQESGAGRFTDVLLPPLNFAEFLRFMDIERDLVDSEQNPYNNAGLNDALVDYINFGAFPEAVVKPEVRAEMSRFVANDIVDKVLLRDLPSLYGIQDTQELKRFFTVLAYNSSMEVSYEGLSQASGVAKNTLRKYLDYLEAAFLIHRLHRLDQNAKRFKRVTHFKVYLTNPCIRAALFGPVDAESPAMGAMVETAYVSQIAPSIVADFYYYGRWKNREVDLIRLSPDQQHPIEATEIKWSDRAFDRPTDELAGLIEFCKNHTSAKAESLTKTKLQKMVCDGVEISFRPVSAICYILALAFIDTPISRGRDPRTLKEFVKKIESIA